VNQVQFLVRTEDTEDLLYLEKLLERNPREYVKTVIESRHGFMAQYQALDPDSIYLKIGEYLRQGCIGRSAYLLCSRR
jgi:hypothetical protein